MPTLAQQAFSEGFTALLDVHGQTWTFGAASFAGVASPLSPYDPRMIGSADRMIELEVTTSSLSTRPAKGDEMIQDGFYYRVARVYNIPNRGITVFLLTETGEVVQQSGGGDFAGSDFSPTDFSTIQSSQPAQFSASDFNQQDFKTT